MVRKLFVVIRHTYFFIIHIKNENYPGTFSCCAALLCFKNKSLQVVLSRSRTTVLYFRDFSVDFVFVHLSVGWRGVCIAEQIYRSDRNLPIVRYHRSLR